MASRVAPPVPAHKSGGVSPSRQQRDHSSADFGWEQDLVIRVLVFTKPRGSEFSSSMTGHALVILLLHSKHTAACERPVGEIRWTVARCFLAVGRFVWSSLGGPVPAHWRGKWDQHPSSCPSALREDPGLGTAQRVLICGPSDAPSPSSPLFDGLPAPREDGSCEPLN